MNEGLRTASIERVQKGNEEELAITESDLLELGITREFGANLEQIKSVFEHFPLLIEGAKRNYSYFLRYAFSVDFALRNGRQVYGDRGRRTDVGHIRAFVNRVQNKPFANAAERHPSERVTVFGDRKEEPRFGAEFIIGLKPNNEYKEYARDKSELALIFSIDMDTARTIDANSASLWTPTDNYRFDGLYFADSSFDSLKRPIDQAVREGDTDILEFEHILKLVEQFTPIPDADVSIAEGKIEELSIADGKSIDDVEKIKQAIKTFATFQKPAPTTGEQCFREIGKCLTAPYVFMEFLRKNYGITDVDTNHYGSALGGFHQVNTWGNVCIDWTARQFSELQNTEYPYVYHIDTPHHLGLPYSKWSEERKEKNRMIEYMESKGIEY